MSGIGIDVGSTYTKYCILKNNAIIDLYSEKTPVKQQKYFEAVKCDLKKKYPGFSIVSCGYGRQNASDGKKINELTALARGANFILPEADVILDIGGQDTKVIIEENGTLKNFFVNDKCAAGSGMFLSNTLQMLEKKLEDIDLKNIYPMPFTLSSVCAVFVQSEIVKLLADNVPPDMIIQAVIYHILIKAKTLLSKLKISDQGVALSGGLTKINGFEEFASEIFGIKCHAKREAPYYSAIGCALTD